MLRTNISILFLCFLANLNAQFSKTYEFGGLDRANNLIINDTSYFIVGSSILNWNDYLNYHGSLIVLRTDLEGNSILKKEIRFDSLKLHLTKLDNLILEEFGYSIGCLVNDTSSGTFLEAAIVHLNDSLGLKRIDFFNSDTTEFISSTVKIKDKFLLYGQVLENTADILLLKIDTAGNEIFRKTYGGLNWEVPGTMIKLNENEFLISGSTDSGAVVRQYSTAYASNGFISKIDSNGNVLWENKLETAGADGPIKVYNKGYISQSVEGKIVDFFQDYAKVYWGQIDVNTGAVLYADTISVGAKSEMNIASIEKVQELQNGDILVLSIGQNDSVYQEYADIRRYNSNKELLWHKTYKNTTSGVAWLYTFQEDTLHNNELVFTGFNHSGIDTFSQDVWVLKLDADGCINSSNCGLAIGMIDISPPKAVFEIEAYPNPAKQYINIAVGNSGEHIGENLQIGVFNSAGKKVYQTKEKLQGQFPVFQVDVSAYTKGVYYIKASVNGQDYGNGQFVKE